MTNEEKELELTEQDYLLLEIEEQNEYALNYGLHSLEDDDDEPVCFIDGTGHCSSCEE
jgi:hypothetical protein